MASHEIGWLATAAGPRRRPAWWARLVAPILTAILVIALGVIVFGLMSPDEGVGDPSRPVAADPASR